MSVSTSGEGSGHTGDIVDGRLLSCGLLRGLAQLLWEACCPVARLLMGVCSHASPCLALFANAMEQLTF